MSLASLEITKAALHAHGLEFLRSDDNTIQLATRVRSHLMDAGVSVHLTPAPNVQFTVRAQGSDYPGVSASKMFAHVRDAVGGIAAEHGFGEIHTHCREIRDPGDDSRVLDLWFELTFSKPAPDLQTLLEDVTWAIGVAKCVGYRG